MTESAHYPGTSSRYYLGVLFDWMETWEDAIWLHRWQTTVVSSRAGFGRRSGQDIVVLGEL